MALRLCQKTLTIIVFVVACDAQAQAVPQQGGTESVPVKPAIVKENPAQTGSAVKPAPPAVPTIVASPKKIKFEGDVLVGLEVDEQGKPKNVHVVHGLGHGLDQQAVTTVQAYKFSPTFKNGKPVRMQVTVAVHFQIFE